MRGSCVCAAGYHYNLYDDEGGQGMHRDQYTGEYDHVYQVTQPATGLRASRH